MLEEDLVTTLRTGLPEFVFRWLQACAVYPVLRLPITLHIGAALARADGRKPPTAAESMTLASLPWFRIGWMPNPLREALIDLQSENDRVATRKALADLAFTVVDASEADELGRVTVARVSNSPPRWRTHWAEWRAGLPKTSHEADTLFESTIGKTDIRFGRREFLLLSFALVPGIICAWLGLKLRWYIKGAILNSRSNSR